MFFIQIQTKVSIYIKILIAGATYCKNLIHFSAMADDVRPNLTDLTAK